MDALNGSGPATRLQGDGTNRRRLHSKGTVARRTARAGSSQSLPPCNGATPQQSVPIENSSCEEERQKAWEACHSLASQPRILDCLVHELEGLGVVGECRAVKLIYLVLTSRLLDRPISAAIKGPSSAGKSYLADRVLSFFPSNAAHILSAMSERAIAYSEVLLKHRTIVVAEAAGLASGVGAYLIRSLISEGKLRYETVESGPGGLKPKLIEREGPTNLLLTTTKLNLDKELETRLFSIPISDSREQTRAIMLAHAARCSSTEPTADPDLSHWIALQKLLELSERRAVIPYAHALVKAIPPVAVRLRRDVPAILGLIQAHAILHQASRETDAQGRIIATLDDYAEVRMLVRDLVATGAGLSVPKTVRETVKAVRDAKLPCGVSLGRIAAALKLDKSTVSRRVDTAIEMGYLRNDEQKKGCPALIKKDEPLPEEVEVLPPPEALQFCSVAGGEDQWAEHSGEKFDPAILDLPWSDVVPS